MGTGDGVHVNIAAFFLAYEAFGDRVYCRKQHRYPEQRTPYERCDLILFEAKGDIANEGRAEKIQRQPSYYRLAPEFEGEVFCKQGKHSYASVAKYLLNSRRATITYPRPMAIRMAWANIFVRLALAGSLNSVKPSITSKSGWM